MRDVVNLTPDADHVWPHPIPDGMTAHPCHPWPTGYPDKPDWYRHVAGRGADPRRPAMAHAVLTRSDSGAPLTVRAECPVCGWSAEGDSEDVREALHREAREHWHGRRFEDA